VEVISSRSVDTLELQSTSSWLRPAGALGLAAAAVTALTASPTLAAEVAAPVQQLAQTISGPSIPGLVGDSQLREGLVSGFLLILFSELGDKTFFIAVLLALKYRSRQGLVFAGSFGALAVMTVISVGLGLVLHEADNVFSPSLGGLPVDDIIAVALLLFFGVRTLQEAADADEKAAEEQSEADETVSSFDEGTGLVLSTFALVFAAEWGDKSFLATIALAAASSPEGVVIGAVAGHGVATLLAILGGNVLSKYVSEKTVQYIGGSLFLVFAAAQIYDISRGV